MQKTINFNDIIKENVKEHNPDWSEIFNYPYRILIFGASGPAKTNSLFNLISQQPDIDKIYFYVKDPYEAKYQLSINNGESAVLKHLSNFKTFIESSNEMDDIYKNIED